MIFGLRPSPVDRFVSQIRNIKRRWVITTAKIPQRALEIWRERPDLRQAFDVSTSEGRKGLLEWYILHGFSELGLGADPGDRKTVKTLNTALPKVRKLWVLPVTRLMHLLRHRSPRPYDLKSAEGQTGLIAWFYSRGLIEANLGSFLQTQEAQELLDGDEDAGGVPRLTRCIWLSAPELHDVFPEASHRDFQDFCRSGKGARAFPILTHPLINLAAKPGRPLVREKPFGVNVIGHAYGRSGVSEDVRMACRVLREADIPFMMRNVSPGAEMPEEDMGEAQASDSAMPYAINMFCMPAPSTVAAALEIGPALLEEYYNIGFWPWELPEMPAFWLHAYHFVDEIWASTNFTHAAFSRSSPVLVLHMPFAIHTDESDKLTRQHFGLEKEKFLFGCAVDGLSSFARKRPLAAVHAFKQAFSNGDQSVGLVIKGIRVRGDPAWAELLDAVGNDERVYFVTESLSRGSLLDLWRGLDCFVSLHRSEGFGRNIAEAMMLRKPVIVTAHSGNMDFTDAESAALVICSLRPVAEGEYPFGKGQLWAEPSIAAAAQQMRGMAADAPWRDRLATAGQARIATMYNPERVGEKWCARLNAIYSA